MPFFKNTSATIYYEDSGGQGPCITLVNGHTRSSKDFNLLSKHLQSKGYRILTLDNRSSGRTINDSNYSLSDMAHDVMMMWEEVGSGHNHLIGFSMGGIISRIAASLYPSKVSSLVLVSTCLANDVMIGSSEWPDSEDELYTKLGEYFSSSFSLKNKLLVKAMARNIKEQSESSNFNLRAQEQRRALLYWLKENVDNLQLQCPTFMLHGAQDRIVPLSQAQRLADQLKPEELQVFQEDGHMLLVENQKGLIEQIDEWIKLGYSRHAPNN